jgi:predicted site-specific integrase-resolvase
MKVTSLPKEAANPGLPRFSYTMRETAQIIGVNYQTVYRLNKRGLLRSSSALRTKLFPADEIQRFLRDTTPRKAA